MFRSGCSRPGIAGGADAPPAPGGRPRKKWLGGDMGDEARVIEEFFLRRYGRHALYLPSGRLALYLAFRQWLRPRDRVLMSPLTDDVVFFTVLAAELVPVLGPVDPSTGNIDPVAIDESTWSGLRAVLTTNLYGIPDRMDLLEERCRRHSLLLLEDAAHAFDSRFDGRRIGLFRIMAAYSLSKHVGGVVGVLTFSEAGQRQALARRAAEEIRYRSLPRALAHRARSLLSTVGASSRPRKWLARLRDRLFPYPMQRSGHRLPYETTAVLQARKEGGGLDRFDQWILSLPTVFSRCSGSRPHSADSPGNWSPRKNVQDSRPRDKELRHSVMGPIPSDKPADPNFHWGGWGKICECPYAFRVGKTGRHVAILHGQVIFLRGPAQRTFQRLDVGHEVDRLVVPDVIDPIGSRARGRVGRFRIEGGIALRSAVQNPDQTLDNVVDIGEVPPHLAVIEHVDWMPFQDRPGKAEQRHIRPAPGAVDREEAQARGREPVEMTVGVRHQLVGLLGRGREADWMGDVVMLRARHPGVSAVDA